MFICVENTCRSQIAEAITNYLYPKKLRAYSAGSNPSKNINPKAIASLNRIGINHNGHTKGTEEIMDRTYDIIVSMGCGETCPLFPFAENIEWDIPDPKAMGKKEFDYVRDLIKQKITFELIR